MPQVQGNGHKDNAVTEDSDIFTEHRYSRYKCSRGKGRIEKSAKDRWSLSCCFLPLPSQLSPWAAVAGKALGWTVGLRRCRYPITIIIMYRSSDKIGQLQLDANDLKIPLE